MQSGRKRRLVRDGGVLAATGIAIGVLEGKRSIQGRRRACRRRRVGRDQLKNFGVRRRGMKRRRERAQRVRVQSVECLWVLAYVSIDARLQARMHPTHSSDALQSRLHFGDLCRKGLVLASASLAAVGLLKDTLVAARLASLWWVSMSPRNPAPLGALRTLHGPLGPLDSSGMHRILILRHLHTVSIHPRSPPHPSCHNLNGCETRHVTRVSARQLTQYTPASHA